MTTAVAALIEEMATQKVIPPLQRDNEAPHDSSSSSSKLDGKHVEQSVAPHMRSEHGDSDLGLDLRCSPAAS